MKKLAKIGMMFMPVFIYSCSQEVWMAEGKDCVVVECVLSCDSIQKLSLSYTRAKGDNSENKSITEAKAVLYDKTYANEVGTFKYIDGEWTIPYSAVPEHEYWLDIDIKGYDHISARQKMPKQVKVGDSFNAYYFSLYL